MTKNILGHPREFGQDLLHITKGPNGLRREIFNHVRLIKAEGDQCCQNVPYVVLTDHIVPRAAGHPTIGSVG